jgi:hypothetical protein
LHAWFVSGDSSVPTWKISRYGDVLGVDAPKTQAEAMTDELRDERELDETPLEAEAAEAEDDDEPDFELHGQYFNSPSE